MLGNADNDFDSARRFNDIRPGAVANMHEPIAARLGVPPLVVLFTFGLFGVVFLAGFCIAAAVWIGPTAAERRKRE